MKVLRTLLVIAIGFLPSLFSLWLMRRNKSRRRFSSRDATRTHFRHAATIPREQLLPECTQPDNGERYYLDGVGYLIGDVSCRFNARSGYLRCAINPCGPCKECRFYESRLSHSENNS